MEHPGLRLSVSQINDQPMTIGTEVDAALAIPATRALNRRSGADGVAAVVIGCMGDPGMRLERV